MLSIDVIMLAYRERNIGIQVRLWQQHARTITVVVGAVEKMRRFSATPRCPVTEAEVFAAAGAGQVRMICQDRYWRDKNEMQQVAHQGTDADLVWQVDADEFYTHDDIESIRLQMEEREWKVAGCRHLLFWKDAKTVLADRSGNMLLLDGVSRVWRRGAGSHLLHIPHGVIVDAQGGRVKLPVMEAEGVCYHSAWCRGRHERVRERIDYHAHLGLAIHSRWWEDVWLGDTVPRDGVHPHVPGLFPTAYDGHVPEGIAADTDEPGAAG